MIASSALRWKMGRPQTLLALIRKEVLQIARDPSALLIAFVLPVILLSLFAFAISLDVDEVRVGVVLESDGPIAGDLAGAFAGTPFLDARFGRDRREFEPMIISGELRGMVVIPADFDRSIQKGQIDKALQIITDGSQPNTANFTSGYLQGVFDTWLASRSNGEPTGASIGIDPRFWFNPELESRRVLLPGAIAIVMTMIGTLLTALVVAREWERGTMEALMSTPASNAEILLGKLVPYFLLGLLTIVGCTGLAVYVFGLPLEGSVIALLILSAAFLLPALGQGLLISTISKVVSVN